MKSLACQTAVLLVMVMALPSCSRIIEWGKSSFYQGEKLPKNLSVGARYVRSVKVLDQFTVVGQFDALWLSPEVRTAQVNMYALKHGKGHDAKNIVLRRQLEETNHFISFYVLSLSSIALEDKECPWSLFLQIDENRYSPIEIKPVDIDDEYQMLFCKKVNKFKLAYLVKFDAKDVEDKQLIAANTKKIELYFRSLRKETVLTWLLTPEGTVASSTFTCKEEDFDPEKDECTIREQEEGKLKEPLKGTI